MEGGLIAAEALVERQATIYLGRNAAGQLYPGHTIRQLRIREAEHIAMGGAKETLTLVEMERAAPGLPARIAEQKLINELGGKAAMESGNLLNIRNAVSPKFWELYDIPSPR